MGFVHGGYKQGMGTFFIYRVYLIYTQQRHLISADNEYFLKKHINKYFNITHNRSIYYRSLYMNNKIYNKKNVKNINKRININKRFSR